MSLFDYLDEILTFTRSLGNKSSTLFADDEFCRPFHPHTSN